MECTGQDRKRKNHLLSGVGLMGSESSVQLCHHSTPDKSCFFLSFLSSLRMYFFSHPTGNISKRCRFWFHSAVGETRQLKTGLKVVVERLKTATQSRSSQNRVSRGLNLLILAD